MDQSIIKKRLKKKMAVAEAYDHSRATLVGRKVKAKPCRKAAFLSAFPIKPCTMSSSHTEKPLAPSKMASETPPQQSNVSFQDKTDSTAKTERYFVFGLPIRQ